MNHCRRSIISTAHRIVVQPMLNTYTLVSLLQYLYIIIILLRTILYPVIVKYTNVFDSLIINHFVFKEHAVQHEEYHFIGSLSSEVSMFKRCLLSSDQTGLEIDFCYQNVILTI